MPLTPVARIRRFNRAYITQLGLFARDYVGEGLSVTDLRVFFETLETPELTARTLARDLDIDEGQVSRILKRYIDMGWLTRTRASDDARRKSIQATPEGLKHYTILNQRADEKTLQRLNGANPARIADAMDTILDSLKRAQSNDIEIRDFDFGDAGWITQRHGEIYSKDPGFNSEFEPFVFSILASFIASRNPTRERAFMAWRGGRRLGSVLCTASEDPNLAKLRLFFVEPDARGFGLGTKLITSCMSFARNARYRRMTLETHQTQETARRLYGRHGFTCTRSGPVHLFGRASVEETWEADL